MRKPRKTSGVARVKSTARAATKRRMPKMGKKRK